MKRLKSKAGMILSIVYLFLFIILMFFVMVDQSYMAGIPLVLFTIPWSILLLSVVPATNFIGFVVVVFSALLNTVILYFLGLLLSNAYYRFNKVFKIFDN